MDRGIAIKIKETDKCILQEIFGGIDIEKYTWYVVDDQSEIWDGGFKEEFFHRSCYDGEAFKQKILQPHFPVFLKLQAYETCEYEFYNICTFEEFQKSTCYLLFLLYDCKTIECYIKDPITREKMLMHARNSPILDVERLTDQNDTRCGMNIL